MKEETTLEDCNSLILGLGRRRFVIIRRDVPEKVIPVGCERTRIRDLQPGDRVVYGGRMQAIESIEVYD